MTGRLGVVGLLLLAPAGAEAQRVSVYGFQQYSFAQEVDAEGTNVPGRTPEQPTPAEIGITQNVRFGVALTVAVTPRVSAEFMWVRYSLEAQIGDGPGRTAIPLDLHASHYLGHVLYQLRERPAWSVFAFAGVGASSLNSSVTGSEHHPIVSGGAGMHGPVRPRIGWRVQARVAPMPAARTPSRTVFGRGNTGAYNVAPTGALMFELYAGATTTF